MFNLCYCVYKQEVELDKQNLAAAFPKDWMEFKFFFFKLCSQGVIPIFWLAHPPLSHGISLGSLRAFPPPAFFSPFVKHHISDVSNISLMILALFN